MTEQETFARALLALCQDPNTTEERKVETIVGHLDALRAAAMAGIVEPIKRMTNESLCVVTLVYGKQNQWGARVYDPDLNRDGWNKTIAGWGDDPAAAVAVAETRWLQACGFKQLKESPFTEDP